MCRLPWGHTGDCLGVCASCRSYRPIKVAQRQIGQYDAVHRPAVCSKKVKKPEKNSYSTKQWTQGSYTRKGDWEGVE